MQLQQAAIAQIVAGGLDNLDLRAAALSGMTPEQYRAGASDILGYFTQQVDALAAKHGLDAESTKEFYEWARTNMPKEADAAMLEHAYKRNLKPYVALIERYMKAVPPTTASLQAGGIAVTTPTRSDADELVTVHGVQMSKRVAAKLGYI